MGYFAGSDTETNWNDQVMSIGTIIADADTFSMVSARYHILTPEYRVGGMFSSTLFDESRLRPIVCSRQKAIGDLQTLFEKYDWMPSSPTTPSSTAPTCPSCGV